MGGVLAYFDKCSIFDWNEDKIKINKAKHGIDFETAKNLWLDEDRVEIQAPHPIGDRKIIIGKYHDKLWAGICTMRDDTIRIISVRRARRREVNLYEEEKLG